MAESKEIETIEKTSNDGDDVGASLLGDRDRADRRVGRGRSRSCRHAGGCRRRPLWMPRLHLDVEITSGSMGSKKVPRLDAEIAFGCQVRSGAGRGVGEADRQDE